MVDDREQTLGSKPVPYDPNQANNAFYGLLAKSPGDFSDSGQIVLAPNGAQFFQFSRTPSVSSFVGDTAEMSFPVVGIDYHKPEFIAVYLRHAPIGE
jgi:hypothetical protein